MSLSSEDIERICSGWSQDLPEILSRTNVRDIVCEMLWQMGVQGQDVPLLMLLILDKYSLVNVLEGSFQKQ